MTTKIKEYPELHQDGFISIEKQITKSFRGDLGIQIGKDGRIWGCVDGEVWFRFRPTPKIKTKN